MEIAMKKILLSLVLVNFLVGCASEKPKEAASEPAAPAATEAPATATAETAQTATAPEAAAEAAIPSIRSV
jgi:hypothetical protein